LAATSTLKILRESGSETPLPQAIKGLVPKEETMDLLQCAIVWMRQGTGGFLGSRMRPGLFGRGLAGELDPDG